MTSHVAQTVENLPAMLETWVQSLGRKDPLEKGMVTHSSILAWRIPWTEESGGYSPWGYKESDMTKQLTPSLSQLLIYSGYNIFVGCIYIDIQIYTYSKCLYSVYTLLIFLMLSLMEIGS